MHNWKFGAVRFVDKRKHDATVLKWPFLADLGQEEIRLLRFASKNMYNIEHWRS